MSRVEFIKFGTKPRDNHTYALDDKGVIWISVDNAVWESLEDKPRRIKQGLTAGQLMQLMAKCNVQIV